MVNIQSKCHTTLGNKRVIHICLCNDKNLRIFIIDFNISVVECTQSIMAFFPHVCNFSTICLLRIYFRIKLEDNSSLVQLYWTIFTIYWKMHFSELLFFICVCVYVAILIVIIFWDYNKTTYKMKVMV